MTKYNVYQRELNLPTVNNPLILIRWYFLDAWQQF